MKSSDNIFNAVKFMEDNIDKKISSEQISFHSTYTVFHFSRVFIGLTGMSPGEYLRKRRLTLAAGELISDEKDIMDTALKYQFQTQEGFTRAFREQFGVSPGKCRRFKPDISAHFTQAVTLEMLNDTIANVKPAIIKLPEMKFIGISIYTNDKKSIIEAWNIFMKNAHKITDKTVVSGRCPDPAYGLEFYADDFFETGKFFYMPAFQVNSIDYIPAEMTAKIIPASKYAVFIHHGKAETVSGTITAAYKSWIGKAGLKAARSFDFEYYGERYKPGFPESQTDIYIPVS